MGLGSFDGGISTIRFLCDRGAHVTVTDLRSESELAESASAIANLPLAARYFGEHPSCAFAECDVLVVNPAVRPGNEFVQIARAHGAMVTSEAELVIRQLPCPVVIVTGSNGKSTTASLIACLIRRCTDERGGRVWLGGNIGHSLLTDIDVIGKDDVAVLELSSFQLFQLRDVDFSPSITVLTSLSPNHLDWHGTYEHYCDAKQVPFQKQNRHGISVLPDDSELDHRWPVRGQRLRFGDADTGEDGVFLEQDTLIFRTGDSEDAVRFRMPRGLMGRHNVRNLCAAACAAWKLGADPLTYSEILQDFRPLPHRIEFVAEGNGIQFYNDSVATTPESSVVALQVFAGRCVLLAGGSDKQIDLRSLANAIVSCSKGVVLMGETAIALAQAIRSNMNTPAAFPVVTADDYRDAFSRAVALAEPGDIVLLSPGCASYDWFRDYRDRGDQFRKLVLEWTEQHA